MSNWSAQEPIFYSFIKSHQHLMCLLFTFTRQWSWKKPITHLTYETLIFSTLMNFKLGIVFLVLPSFPFSLFFFFVLFPSSLPFSISLSPHSSSPFFLPLCPPFSGLKQGADCQSIFQQPVGENSLSPDIQKLGLPLC